MKIHPVQLVLRTIKHLFLSLVFKPGKEIESLHKLKFSYPYIFVTWRCKSLIFQSSIIWPYMNSKFEITKVHAIELQRYRDKKIRNSGRDSIPFSSIYARELATFGSVCILKTCEEQTVIYSPDEEKSVLVNPYRFLCKLSR